jgi:hypothetical protein
MAESHPGLQCHTGLGRSVSCLKGEGNAPLQRKDITIALSIGTAFTPAGEEEFALTEVERMQHVFAVGKSGRGKSTLLESMLVQDMEAARGIGLIEPHGDLSRAVLSHLPSYRSRDLVLIDPADEERIVTFNVVAPRSSRVAFRAASVVGALKGLFADSWGYRLERILYNAVAALIEAPATSLLSLPALLKSEAYRHEVLAHVSDPIVHDYFASEYEIWDEKFRTTALDPVLNKVEQLLAAPFVRATLGCVQSSIDFASIMDERKIFIANLSKGCLGASHAHVLGGLIVSCFADAAMMRSQRPMAERIPFYLYADEFQNITTESFAEIFSELRKMKLGAVLSHQFLSQAPPALVDAILGNVGTIIAFELSGKDAEAIAGEIGLKSLEPLTQLSVGEVWAKHPVHGLHHPRLLLPPPPRSTGRDAALKENAMRNTFPRERVDAAIERFLRRRASHRSSGLGYPLVVKRRPSYDLIRSGQSIFLRDSRCNDLRDAMLAAVRLGGDRWDVAAGRYPLASAESSCGP